MLGGAAVKGRPFCFQKSFDLYLLMFLRKQLWFAVFTILAIIIGLSKPLTFRLFCRMDNVKRLRYYSLELKIANFQVGQR